jgi:hypothetical protein
MHPKPPVTRTGKSGRLGHQVTRLKGLVVIGAIALGFAGTALIAASPASADPAFNFTAVGSDTTENVMDFFAGQVGGGILASYDAVNPLSQITGEPITPGVAQAGGAQQLCSFTRPNGSGAGFNALDFSYNPTTGLGQTGTAPQQGCIAISRSSSGAGSVAASGPGAALSTGNFVYIPFAIDAVTYATGPTTATSVTTQCVSTTTGCGNVVSGIGTITFTTTPTAISQTADFTIAQLQTLYGTCSNLTVGSTVYNPNTATSGQQQVDLYAPQNGSGTLSFWETTMGVTAVQPCWHQTIVAGPATGIAVEEHDGTALASDPDGIAPISIAKWIGMNNGVITPDVRHSDVLQSITVGSTPVAPINGGGSMNVTGCLTGTHFVQSACFPVTREVYNVMDFYQVVNTPPLSGTVGNPAFSATLSGLFAGTSSALCTSTFTIQNLGFGTIPAANSAFANPCGDTSTSTLRVQMNNTAAQG